MPVGRPSKLTEELEAAICDSLRAGNHVDNACALHGVGKTTFYDWFNKGEAGYSAEHVRFANAVRKARAQAEDEMVRFIRAAIHGKPGTPWQPAAWWLERAASDRWALRPNERVREEQAEALARLRAGLNDDEYRKSAALISGENTEVAA